jgi:hypothetical protein
LTGPSRAQTRDNKSIGDIVGRVSQKQRRRHDQGETLDRVSGLAFMLTKVRQLMLQGRDACVEDSIRSFDRVQLVEKRRNAIGFPGHGAKNVEANHIAGAFPNTVERRLAIESNGLR